MGDKMKNLLAFCVLACYSSFVQADELAKSCFNMVVPVVRPVAASPVYELVRVCDPRTRTCHQELRLVNSIQNISVGSTYYTNGAYYIR